MRFMLILMTLTAINLLTVPTAYTAEKSPLFEERLDIDPVVQGLWKLHASSSDKGVTVKQHNGLIFARVSALQVVTLDADMKLQVKKVMIFNPEDGSGSANVVTFTNGVVWIVSKPNNYVLVQVANDKMEETFRFIVTVHK